LSGKTGEALIDEAIDQAFGEQKPEPQVEAEVVEDDADESDDDEELDDEAESDDEAEGDDDADDDGDEPADEWLLEGRFKKGDEQKLAESYKSLESMHSKTVNELKAEIAKEREAAGQRALVIAQAMMQTQQQTVDPVALSQRGVQLEQAALTDPASAYQAAIQSGDENLITRVISRVAKGLPDSGFEANPAMAQQMMADYQARAFATQQGALQQQMMQQQQELALMRAQTTVESVVAEFERKFPDYEEVKPLIGEFLQANADRIDFSNAQTLMGQLETAYDAAIGRAAREARAGEPQRKQEQLQQQRRTSYVESGTPGQSKPKGPVKDANESFADSLMEFAASERPRNPFQG